MKCEEAGEFVSALCDGVMIPRGAAEHIGACATCQALLEEYLAMGAELRRFASLESPAVVEDRAWVKPQGTVRNWWQKGWETTRIPRFAFALLLLAVVGLTSGLAIVGVRARTQGTVIMLKVAAGPDQPSLCPISTVDKNWDICGMVGKVNSGDLTYEIKFLSKDGSRIELGVRARFGPPISSSGDAMADALRDIPQKQYWFEPGERLQIEVAGFGTMVVTGEWLDHMPSLVTPNGVTGLDPGPDEFRMIAPLLLRNKEVVFDFEAGSVFASDKFPVIEIYAPQEGLFELSLVPLQGAIEGRIVLNRIDFKIDGDSYSFLTAAPIARSKHVWILRNKRFNPTGELAGHEFISNSSLDHMISKDPARN